MTKIMSLMLMLSMVFQLLTVPVMAEEAETSYPMLVIDQAGREVHIEREPESIVSAYYISTSCLIGLGLTDHVVGIESGAEKRPIYKMSAPSMLDLPNVGSIKEFDLEACAALQPDLVILPMKLKEAAATLEELGITVLIVNPESQDLLKEMIQVVSQTTNREAEAAELIGFIENQETALAEGLKDVEMPRVYLGGNSDFLSTASSGMYQNSLIELAGGANVAGEIDDTYWVETSYEQILSWDPEYIILASNANYSVEDILADENLSICTAVQNGNVYHIPSDYEAWDSPVPGGILGAVWLSGILHPDLISEEEGAAVISDYYEKFYGVQTHEN